MLQCPPFPLPLERSRLLSALSTSSSPNALKQILARAIISSLFAEPFVSARIVAAFAPSDLSFAQLAFDASPRRSAFSYTSMIRAHSAGPTPYNSLVLFSRMLHSGIYPDRFAFPFLLRASARSLSPPSFIHAISLRHGLDGDIHVATSLIHAYASSGLFDFARKVLDEMPHKTEVTWSAIISCCSRSAQQQQQEDGLFLFNQMISTGVRPNADTLIVALSCCAGIGSLTQGKALHSLSIRLLTNISIDEAAATALINMYARCGNLNCALNVFDRIPTKDSSTWTAMIGGLAMHGCGAKAIAFFDMMVEDKDHHLQPDSVTFTAVLHACSHSGLVQTGIRLFNDMKTTYGIEPRMEHYGAMVDMLSRAGRLEEAERMVASMPFQPNQIVWGSLLHACLVRGELAYGEKLERRLLGLGFGVEEEEEFGGGFFVGLSNVYAGACRWEEVGRVRERMVERGVRKESAFSLLEIEGKMHRFLVGDVSHPLAFEIYQMLHGINEYILLI